MKNEDGGVKTGQSGTRKIVRPTAENGYPGGGKGKEGI